ncbi:MAG: hypothetical protein HFK10_04775 [Clostridia bacterium]|nr:hypothetical protein [Clostridia bacterium]
MKKVAKVLGVVAVAVCMCLSLAACGKVEGKYVGSKTLDERYTVTMTIELKKGDECEMTMTISAEGEEGESETAKGTYKVEGDTITITIDGNSQTFDYKKGKSITYKEGGETLELKK